MIEKITLNNQTGKTPNQLALCLYLENFSGILRNPWGLEVPGLYFYYLYQIWRLLRWLHTLATRILGTYIIVLAPPLS